MTALPQANRVLLHGLLRAAAEPWLNASVEPIIIGWYQYQSKDSERPNRGIFRLQYGSRAWSTSGYPSATSKELIVPRYQAKFEQQAIALREANWDLLSAGLLESEPTKNVYGHLEVEMFMMIGDLSCHFGVRSKSPKQEAYFLVTEAGLAPDPARPQIWFDAWPEQMTPRVFLPTHMPDPDRRNTTELAQRIAWTYQTPLMPFDEVSERLGALLMILFKRLAGLGKAVAIATSPHRFNDAAGDNNWLAAFVDGARWENGVYFTSSAKTLASAPRALHEAMGLLQEVLASGVREKLAEYLGNHSAAPDTLILSSDSRGYLIALSSSTENGGPVYGVDQENGLPSLIGVAPRLDWRFAECISTARDSANKEPSSEIVQFVLLREWIEKRSTDDVPFEYPNLSSL